MNILSPKSSEINIYSYEYIPIKYSENMTGSSIDKIRYVFGFKF